MSQHSFNRTVLAALTVSIIALAIPGFAQDMIRANAGDRADARANQVNPAAIAAQAPLFTLGSNILHTGISTGALDLRNSYFSLTASRRKLGGLEDVGYGLTGQILQTTLYSTVLMSASIAKLYQERFAIGASLGVLNSSFNRGELRVEDDTDPSLQNLSKWVFPDVGIGGLAVVNRYLTLGIGLSHLTEPNVSLDGGKVALPRSYYVGAAVGLGYFRGLFSLDFIDGEALPTIAIESFRPGLGFLRAGYGREAASVEAQVHVMQGVNFSYRYNLPINEIRLASNGSHEIGLVFNFRKTSSIYNPEWLEPDISRPPVINPNTAFIVESVYDTLVILDRHITRMVDSTITQEMLAQLPRDLLISGDSLGLEPKLPSIGAARLRQNLSGAVRPKPDSTRTVIRMEKDHSKRYLEYMRDLMEGLKEDPKLTARIVAPFDAKRLDLLLDYLSLYGEITDRLQIAIQEPDSTLADSTRFGGKLGPQSLPRNVDVTELSAIADTFKFDLNLPELRYGPVSWTFFIADGENRVLKSINGKEQVLRRYVWDWTLEDGQLISPGKYYYFVKWQAEDGTVYTSPKKMLVISKADKLVQIQISLRRLLAGKQGGKLIFFMN